MKDVTSQILDTLREVPAIQQGVKERMDATVIVHSLIQMRAEAGLSQTELAKRMGCTQSRISKIEHSLDEELSIGDLNNYIRATGHWSVLTIADTKQTMAGMARHHILIADSLLKKITEKSSKSRKIRKDTDNLSLDLIANFLQTLEQTAEKIPNSPMRHALSQAYQGMSSPGNLVLTFSRAGNQ